MQRNRTYINQAAFVIKHHAEKQFPMCQSFTIFDLFVAIVQLLRLDFREFVGVTII